MKAALPDLTLLVSIPYELDHLWGKERAICLHTMMMLLWSESTIMFAILNEPESELREEKGDGLLQCAVWLPDCAALKSHLM